MFFLFLSFVMSDKDEFLLILLISRHFPGSILNMFYSHVATALRTKVLVQS
jgi:hypothetical protein